MHIRFSAIAALFCLSLSPLAAQAIDSEAKQAIVIDDSTNTVLFAKNADEKMHPSSMSKLMTVYLAFKRLHEGSLKLTDQLPISEKAWRTQGSKTFVEIGGKLGVDELLQGIIVQSGNDACVVIAEALAGSEESFAVQMNEMAKEMGMTNTNFDNATGLPDDKHLMSARDLAVLSQHVIHDYPEYYHYFSQKEFVHHGITQGNRNLLLYKKDSRVDGLKTGHTDAGGFGMVATEKDVNGRRILVVVNGLPTDKARAEEAERLLAFGFRDFDAVALVKKGDKVDDAEVWFGDKPTVSLTVDKDAVITLPKTSRSKLKFTLVYNAPVPAPVKQGSHIADLKIESPDAPAITLPLVAAENVDEVHGFSRMMRTLHYYVSHQ